MAEKPKVTRAPKSNHQCGGCGYYGYNRDETTSAIDPNGWCKHPGAPADEVVLLSDHCEDFKAWKMPVGEVKRLPWEYCECGCKGWNLEIGGVYFHLFWDLKDKWYLSSKHGVSSTRKVYKSAPEAEAVVAEALRKAVSERADEHLAITEALAALDEEGEGS